MRTLPAWVEIDLDALVHNIQFIRRRLGPDRKILLIVKADAYGHGAVEIAREAIRAGVYMLGVATVDEGRELRNAGIEAAILVLSPALLEEIPALLQHNLRMTIPSLEFAEELSRQALACGKLAPVHIEIDTGMGRSGFDVSEALEGIRAVARLPGLLIEGLFTHFPVSDTDVETTVQQVRTFSELVERARQSGVRANLIHASNSAGVLQVPQAHLDMVRAGGLIYGALPDERLQSCLRSEESLRAVMSFRARLVQVRHLPPRHSISYGGDVMTCRDVVLGVVPVGYGHGLSRGYSGSGSVLFRGQRVRILGRITMDMTMVDLSDFEAPEVGEEVVVFGRQGNALLQVSEVGSRTGTLGYEALCSISKRVVRVYKRDGKIQSMRGLTGERSIASPL